MVKLNLDMHSSSSCSVISEIIKNSLSTLLVDLGVGDQLIIKYRFLDNNRVQIDTVDEMDKLIGTVLGTMLHVGCCAQILEDDLGDNEDKDDNLILQHNIFIDRDDKKLDLLDSHGRFVATSLLKPKVATPKWPVCGYFGLKPYNCDELICDNGWTKMAFAKGDVNAQYCACLWGQTGGAEGICSSHCNRNPPPGYKCPIYCNKTSSHSPSTDPNAPAEATGALECSTNKCPWC